MRSIRGNSVRVRRFFRCLITVMLGWLVLAAAGAYGQEVSNERLRRRVFEELRRIQQELVDARVRGEDTGELEFLLKQMKQALAAGDVQRAAAIARSRKEGEVAGPVEGWDEQDKEETKREKMPYYRKKQRRYYSGELVIRALAYEPITKDGEEKVPGVVLVHGGFDGVPVSTRRFASFLAQGGMAVFVPYLRGQGGSGGEIEYARGEVEDVVSAVGSFRGEIYPYVDTSRIALLGMEHGANCALLAASQLGDRIAACIAVSPKPDLVTLVGRSHAVRRHLRSLNLPFSLGNDEELVARSPLYHWDGVQCPLLILHGGLDREVPQELVKRYATRLAAKDIDHELHVFPQAHEDLADDLPAYRDEVLAYLRGLFFKEEKDKDKVAIPEALRSLLQQLSGGGNKPGRPKRKSTR